MCTVTVLPTSVLPVVPGTSDRLRLRVACNRDELLTRPPALPPATYQCGGRRLVMPIDPESGGTWIGANDAGLVCALLNVYDGRETASADLSRGTIVPPLLRCADVESAVSRAADLPVRRYLPFRLLVIGPEVLVECVPVNGRLEHRRLELRDAVMRTSSGLGDALVAGPRGALFRTFLEHASDPVAAADLFHLHQWRGREAISVRMRRLDARTVSHTVVEVRDRSVRLVYRPADAPSGVAVTVAA